MALEFVISIVDTIVNNFDNKKRSGFLFVQRIQEPFVQKTVVWHAGGMIYHYYVFRRILHVMALTDEECYVRLREAIMREELLPNERLIEMDLAQSLGAGRAAIRTALARLEQEGLVQRERYRGARVRLISEAEAIEILEVRASLESLVARYAAINATPEDCDGLFTHLAEQQRCIEVGNLLRSSEINGKLHQTLLRIANHATATRLLDMLKPQNVRFQYRTILVPGRPENSLQEHRAIVNAVANHDSALAETAMRVHLSHVAEALRQARKTRQISQGEGEHD
jgi:DNA-binding GntR family transcriptional regulator